MALYPLYGSKNKTMTVRELNGIDEMLSQISVMQELYPSLTEVQ